MTMTKKILIAMMLSAVIVLAGCNNGGTTSTNTHQALTDTASTTQKSSNTTSASDISNTSQGSSEELDTPSESGSETNPAASESTLEVCFGDDGEPFTMHLYDNSTAEAIVKHVGTADWRLPIYHFDDYDNWESFQYYDVPSRYEIPSNAETVTSAKGGDVFYSEPNRIVMFYHDAEISAEYTKVGYFDYTDEFVSAVENNPVLEGWGNKIVLIRKDN